MAFVMLSYTLFGEEQTSDSHEMLLGKITAHQLTANFEAFDNTNSKTPLSEDSITALTEVKGIYTIKAFLGTWCHDSEREIPILLDIIKAAGNPNLQLELIALNMDKQDPDDLAKLYQIKNTPTIVIEANGKELGRIVERPENSLEDNLLAIIESSDQ